MEKSGESTQRYGQEGFDHEHIAPMTGNDRIRVRVKTRPACRPTYTIQLECRFDETNEWVPVFRADDFHGQPHLDILHPDGTKQKEWLFDWGDDRRNMKAAQEIVRARWEQERNRYESELNRQ